MIRRRARRTTGDAGANGMTPEDRQAIRTYRANRGSSRYYSDLKAIDIPSMPTTKPAGDSEK